MDPMAASISAPALRVSAWAAPASASAPSSATISPPRCAIRLPLRASSPTDLRHSPSPKALGIFSLLIALLLLFAL